MSDIVYDFTMNVNDVAIRTSISRVVQSNELILCKWFLDIGNNISMEIDCKYIVYNLVIIFSRAVQTTVFILCKWYIYIYIYTLFVKLFTVEILCNMTCIILKYVSIILRVVWTCWRSRDELISDVLLWTPNIWPGKSRTTSLNIHSAAMWGYGM